MKNWLVFCTGLVSFVFMGCGSDSNPRSAPNPHPVEIIPDQISDMTDLLEGREPQIKDDFESLHTEADLEVEKIFMPYLYGMQNDDAGLKCDPTIAGGFGSSGKCKIPNSRTIKLAFVEGSCNSWWDTRWGNVLDGIITLYNDMNGWNVQIVDISEANYFVGCTTDPSMPLGYFDPGSSVCQNVPGGKICKYSSGIAAVNTAKIEARSIWASASSLQRRKNANNSINHEIEHLLGHGHYSGNQGGTKVMAQGYPLDLTTPIWNMDVQIEQVELDAVDCFNPGSSTSSLCP